MARVADEERTVRFSMGESRGAKSGREARMTPEDFAESAHPHSWLLVADDLHKHLKRLYASKGSEQLIRTDYRTGQRCAWDGVNRGAFLLGGFVLENAIKAFLVYENREWVSNGKLCKHLLSHALVDLANRSSRIPHKRRGKWILKAFEAGLESWARYPCGTSAAEQADPDVIDDRLWDGYFWLARAYGRRLRRLLSDGWRGPHGIDGHFEISPDFLELETPP